MRRRVAICKFNLADYSRWEGQEGVGLQGGNATGADRKNGGSVYSLIGVFILQAREDRWLIHRPTSRRIHPFRFLLDRLA